MRIFLAAPADVAAERSAVGRVVDQLNHRFEGERPPMTVVDWGHHLLATGRPFDPTDPPVGPRDIFLGISWLRFDAPGDGDSAATETDFVVAFESWRQARRPRCLFYRCMRLPASLRDVDGGGLMRVQEVLGRIGAGDKRPLVQEYLAVGDLERHLERTLTRAIELTGEAERREAEELLRRAPAGVEATPEPVEEPPTPTSAFEAELEVGKAYDVTFLSLELARWEGLVERHADRQADLETLAHAFRQMVTDVAAIYGGEVFRWEPAGGLLLFWRQDSHDHAVMTALKVLHGMPVFVLDPQQNPLPEPLSVRIAAHDAVIVFQRPVSALESPALDFVVDLQRSFVSPGELGISERLMEKLDERLRPHFKFKGRHDREAIYSCRLPSSERQAEQANLDDFVDKLELQTAIALALLEPGSTLGEPELEALSSAVDEAYGILNRFCLAFGSLDRGSTPELLRRLAAVAGLLRAGEAKLWQGLRRRHAIDAEAPPRLVATVRAASRRRSRSVVLLEKLEERCRQLVPDEVAPAAPPVPDAARDELGRKIQTFLKADALDNETALTDLLLNHKAAVLAFLTGEASDPRHRPLIEKLWQTADLVVLDDLYSIREHRRAGDARVIDAVTAEPIADGRFRIVKALLEGGAVPSEAGLKRGFERLELAPGDEDLQIVWRCLVLGHPDDQARSTGAFRLTPYSMWQAVSHPSIPIDSIYAIGERLNRSDDEDSKRIFFDCTRSRVEAAIEGARGRDDLDSVARLVLLLLDFPFLVETGYFERFDDLLRKFLARSEGAEYGVAFFNNLRQTLERAHQQSGGKDGGPPPTAITRLPLTIQRRLAGEAKYVTWFVSHPDARIAGETLRHIGLANVERILRIREVNAIVFHALLAKQELFTRLQPLVVALNHPKCTQQFANRYLGGMARSHAGRSSLQKLVNNPSANPQVRALAKRAVERTRAAG